MSKIPKKLKMKPLIEIKENSSNSKIFQSLLVHFETKKDLKNFGKLIQNKLEKKNIIIEQKSNIINYYIKKFNLKNQFNINKLISEEDTEIWKKYWKEMPEYNQKDKRPYKTILIHFKDKESRKYFIKLTGNKINNKTKYIYYPKIQRDNLSKFKCISEQIINPKYPIYIISKGRWESRLTSKSLEEMKVPYYIIIEPQEYNEYSAVIDKKKIKILPFSNLGQGSIPVRNWVWEDSIKRGYKRHWVMDDNIDGFYRTNNNQQYKITNGNVFRIIEKFTDRFSNIGLTGLHYRYFFPKRTGKPPFHLNTRIYSCLLVNNSLPFRWRGKYNEDTDISIRVLKKGLCTILFNIFVCNKITTMIMKGGNTEEIYGNTNKRREFAESLVKQHPDITKIVWRYNRWHHQVDYSGFRKNKLKWKKGIKNKLKNEINEYGMKLIELD